MASSQAQPLLDDDGEERHNHGAAGTQDSERELATLTDQKTGLTQAQVANNFEQYGFNELPEKKVNPLLMFLAYFWGPMPIMIWAAALIELGQASAGLGGWDDFAVLMMLQFANAIVGYIEERNAGDAIQALKNQLAPKCHVCRDGRWQDMPAKNLVPGDLIEIKLGDVVPADAILLAGQSLQVDQAALTGESLPVTMHPGDKLKMGSAIKRGETKCIVVATGANTFFGKAAGLISQVVHVGRFQKILYYITLTLLVLCLVLSVAIYAKLVVTLMQGPNTCQLPNTDDKPWVAALSNTTVILVASIPVAIEVVCTSTLAVGSHRLAQKKVIVAKLSAIEELAGMTILCSDKTGTLTLNQLSLREPKCFGDMTEKELMFYSAMASKREVGNQDAIDLCITAALSEEDRTRLHAFKELDFFPFNPTDKRTEATIQPPAGSSDSRGHGDGVFKITKGAPQVILRLSHNAPQIREGVEKSVQEFADRGFRALGVAISYTGVGEPTHWEFQGVLSLFDPPRADTKATIAAAIANGIEVKMVTGDQTAIAKETCRELGMGTNILNTEILNDSSQNQFDVDQIIMEAHGFAEVMPEHKFLIVDRIRQLGHVTGMTGDGVNDAPALKRADIGIAVHGATDAAKAAADIVLTEPGLSVIIDAIFRSRKIFQRMRNYCIYRIACTIQLLFFFFFAIMTIDPYADFFYGTDCGDADMVHQAAFVLPVISLVIITILNDGTMITISHDKVVPEKRPQVWAMVEVTIVALVLGLVACLSSLIFLVSLLHYNKSHAGSFMGAVFGSYGRDYILWQEARTMIYLKISLSDFLTLFSARTRVWFWDRRPGFALGAAAVFATMTSTILSLFWDDLFSGVTDTDKMNGLRHSQYACVGIWLYVILWFFVQDICKVATYWAMQHFSQANMDRVKTMEARGRLAALMDQDRKDARRRGEGGCELDFATSEQVSTISTTQTVIDGRVGKLEAELQSLRALVQSMRVVAAAGGVAGTRDHSLN